jgi:aspartyl-tRNA synthetase
VRIKRTQNCGELKKDHAGKTISLNGWVENYRDHGGVTFIDLTDRWGLTQIVFDPTVSGDAHKTAQHLRSQDVIAITGKVSERPDGMANDKLNTGAIEIYVTELEVLNKSKTPPFDIHHADGVNQESRLKYRFLDLRGHQLQKNLIFRSRVTNIIRNFFIDNEFVDVETPILTKATPEGARDYLVPSRVNEGKFYALPQSPQLFKQSLMISGFDKYFQIARCFRDEDLRADRQPEFTQVDVEMAFVDQDDVIGVIENLFKVLLKEVFKKDLNLPLPRMTYDQAMLEYGKDAPDLRFDLKIVELNDVFKESGFGVFANAIADGGFVRAIIIKNGIKSLSRKDLDEMTPFVKTFRAKGAAWIKVNEDGPQSPIVKFFKEGEIDALYKKMGAETGDIIVFIADKDSVVCQSLGALRVKFAEKLSLIDENELNFSWVVDFPMFVKDGDGKPTPTHHPFTAPKTEDEDKLDSDIYAAKSNAYDIVLNGTEIGGGSIRIHNNDMQQKIFSLLGIEEKEAKEKFGFLMDALQYGAPPHGGLALGLDRILMHFLKTESIRDVIAFPKTQKATCLMTDAPGSVSNDQLEELFIESTAEILE